MGASLKFTSIHAISIFFPKSAIFALSSCIYLVSEPNLASYDSSPYRPHLRDALTTHRGHLLVACIVRTLLLIVQPKTQLSSSTLSIQALFPKKPKIRPFSDPPPGLVVFLTQPYLHLHHQLLLHIGSGGGSHITGSPTLSGL